MWYKQVVIFRMLFLELLLLSAFMTSLPGKKQLQHILPNLWRRKDNQAMKIIEYNMTNIFLKSYAQDVVQTHSKLSIFQDQLPKVLCSLSLLYVNLGLLKYIETKLHTTCFVSDKAFPKNKKRSRPSFPASFHAWSLKKDISLIIFY